MGPFEVLKRVGKVAYLLDLLLSMQQHPFFHVALLLRDKSSPNHMHEEDSWEHANVGTEDEWEVEYVLDSRVPGADVRCLVKWRGFLEEHATWVPVDNLASSRRLVKAYRGNEARKRREAIWLR